MNKVKNVRLHKELTQERVNEFNLLDYAGKLRFMDVHFKGFATITEGENEISVTPTTPNEVRKYNEWRINLFKKVLPCDEFTDYFFEWLRDRYNATIKGIKQSNKFFDLLIQQYINEQLMEYEPKLQAVRHIINRYNGAWDLSAKVIDDYPGFMRAKAISNYVGFLTQQQKAFKPQALRLPQIPEETLKKLHERFNGRLWNEMTVSGFIELFDPENTKHGKLKGIRRGHQTLIAYLFSRTCQKLEIPYTNLKHIVGKFDNCNYDHGQKPHDPIMLAQIREFVDKMTIKALRRNRV